MRNIISRNPYSGKILQQIPFSTHEKITKQLQNARQGFEIQSHHQTKQKISMIRDLITLVEKRRQQIANLITQETGKLIIQSQFQVKKALSICSYYASHHQGLFSFNVKTQAKKKTLVKHLPLGTVYCVLPAMYPFLLNFYKTIPQLILGNSVLVRHAHNTPGTARIIEKIMKRVGFQSGEYQCIWNSYSQTETILKDINVIGLNFTGSTKNGSKLASLAGKHLKKYQIQADQNNILILLQDGNIELALQNLLKSGFFNSGQGLCPKKIIIHNSIVIKFQDLLAERIKSIKFGNPQQKQTNAGPIMTPELYQKLKNYKNELSKSSKMIFERPELNLPFFGPCIFECNSKTPDLHVDGPLFQFFRYQQQAQIKSIVSKFTNVSSVYIFTNRKDHSLFQNLAVGNIFFNTINHYDPHVPLGGSSSSGFWKQGWQESLKTFANIKIHYIN